MRQFYRGNGLRFTLAIVQTLLLTGSLSENVREEGSCVKTELESGIRLQNLSYAYEAEKPVLQDVNFTFEAGKSYALVGASGSGKSTLLNLLMASDPSYGGAIRFDRIVDVEKLSTVEIDGMVFGIALKTD